MMAYATNRPMVISAHVVKGSKANYVKVIEKHNSISISLVILQTAKQYIYTLAISKLACLQVTIGQERINASPQNYLTVLILFLSYSKHHMFCIFDSLPLSFKVKRTACNPNPCLNNAQCIVDSIRGFQCVCLEGYSGRTCDSKYGLTTVLQSSCFNALSIT